MKTFLVGIAALAALSAAPALAQTGGAGTGIGGTIGFNNTAAGTNVTGFKLDQANTIAGGSGSGFQADFSGKDGAFAIVAGAGIAGSATTIGQAGLGGAVNSTSYSLGGFGGYASEGGKFTASAMNFAQSDGKVGFTSSLSVKTTASFSQAQWAEIGGNFGNWAFNGF